MTDPYGMPPYRPQPPYNTYAILALILALMVFPPLGIYFGAEAKKQIAVSGERGIEMAQVAIIVGWVLTGIMLLTFLFFCAFAGLNAAFFATFAAVFGGTATSGTPDGF